MAIRWRKEFVTGQPLLDMEHRILVMLFKKLDIAIKTSRSEATLTRIVSEVRKFADFHFVSEENLMRETGYPGFDKHHRLHTDLMTELNAKIARVVAHREDPQDLLDFLNNWLAIHIAKHDKHLADHVIRSDARPVAERLYDEYLPPTAYLLDD